MNFEKIKEIESLFLQNDAKLVSAYNESGQEGIERQIYFLQTRLLLTSSVLAQLLSTLTEEYKDGKVKE